MFCYLISGRLVMFRVRSVDFLLHEYDAKHDLLNVYCNFGGIRTATSTRSEQGRNGL